MKKSEKIKILDKLIEKATNLTCTRKASYTSVVRETISFIRNALDKESANDWAERIKKIPHGSCSYPENSKNSCAYSINTLNEIIVLIKNEVALYEEDDKDEFIPVEYSQREKTPIIFLSHSSTDKRYGDTLREFITGLGVKDSQLIYTSHQLHKVPLDENIYDYLRKSIDSNIFIIFLLSDEYFSNAICLNEMGAVWVRRSDYTNIFTPDFDFNNEKFHNCVIDTKKMGVNLKGDSQCKASMIELKNKILSMFNLTVAEAQTIHLLDTFVEKIMEISK